VRLVNLCSRQQGRQDAQHRSACEARHWIREGYYTGDRVNELMTRIAQRRGAAAATALREEMRRQWARRAEWLDGADQ